MPKENINIELIKVLKENFKNPFIAISPEGNIITYNRQAANFFSIKEGDGNIFDFILEDTSFALSSLMEEVLGGKKTITKNIILGLKNGTNIKSQVTINEFRQTYIFITLKSEEYKLTINEITNLKVKQEEFSKLIKNQEIKKIIENIQDLYPFTVLGKEKIRREVDQFEEFFWIKNDQGIFILVNGSLAKNLGLRSIQIEGRSEKELLPEYLREVYSSLITYIKKSHNLLVLEGIPIQGLSAASGYQTIEIPLINSEGNLAAIIGIGQKMEISRDTKYQGEEQNLLENLPVSLAILNNEGMIRHSSKEFCKLFSDEFHDFRNLSYTNVFPLEISDRIKKFLDSYSDVEEFQIKLSKKGEWKEREFNVLIKRNIGEDRQPEGLSIFLEDISPYIELERIINTRGKMYEVLIQNNPEPIFIYDKENLHFIDVNQAALTLYGYRRDEFLKMDLTDLYTPEDIQTLLDSSTGGIREGIFTGPYRHKKKNGESVFVEISKISFRYSNKDAHFNVIKDITKYLETEKKNQLFKAAFDNSINMIFTTDSSGFIKSANAASENILGKEESELINSSFASLVKDEDRGLINSTIFNSAVRGRTALKTSLKKSNGELFDVEITASPIVDYKNEIESFVLVLKSLEKESVHEKQVKEIIVEKIVEKVKETPDKIDPAFLSGFFHEILTPINAMLGFVQELSESIEQMTPDQKEAKDIIDQNRRRLLSTMNSVVEYTRFTQEEPRLEVKNVSITEIVDGSQEDISDILKNKGIDFAYGKISSSLNFKTDSPKFTSLIILLFKIASQFTNSKKIYFSAYHFGDNNFLVSIQDNYSSMSSAFSENFNNIFNKQEILKDYGVSKLSITLARILIDLLQGRYVEKSKKNSGFVFPIELKPELKLKEIQPEPELKKENEKVEPGITVEEESTEKFTQAEEEDEIEEEIGESEKIEEEEEIKFIRHTAERKVTKKPDVITEKSHVDLSQLSCLYIEDQVDSQILFKVQLKELREIKFAVSFEEALPLLDSNHFDFIVLDINLQGEYNGLDALKIIHRMPGYELIPIIAVTAYVLPGDREKFIAAGFNDFISKPIFREKIVNSLETIFNLTHS